MEDLQMENTTSSSSDLTNYDVFAKLNPQKSLESSHQLLKQIHDYSV